MWVCVCVAWERITNCSYLLARKRGRAIKYTQLGLIVNTETGGGWRVIRNRLNVECKLSLGALVKG